MQFEDADEDAIAAPLAAGHAPVAVVDFRTPRAGATFVDDESLPDEDEEEDEDEDDFDEDDEDWDADAGLDEGLLAVMDQDWADAAGGASHPPLPSRLGESVKLTLALRRCSCTTMQTLPSATTA